MAQELELKLSLPPQHHQAFKALSLFAGGNEDQHSLFNAYYDTPDLQLQTARIALRIRRKGPHFIQTLKTSGSSEGGLHNRQEWEWELDQAVLDSKKVREVMPSLDIPWEQLETLFETDFIRSTWVLETLNSSIEIALDCGAVKQGSSTKSSINKDDHQDPISEVELELKSGETYELFTIAAIMVDELPLRVSRISKAERGYRLLLGANKPAITSLDNPESCLSSLQQHLEWLDFIAPDHPDRNTAFAEISDIIRALIEHMPAPLTLEVNPVLQQTADTLSTSTVDNTELFWELPFCQALLKLSGYLCLNPSNTVAQV